MKKLIIRHLGPISDSGVMQILPVTVLCGKQGSGKSTIAKILSTCLWLEKALLRGDFSTKYVESYNRFRNNYCGFHRIAGFFKDNTYIEYDGEAYSFRYENGHFHTERKMGSDYLVPKVMYIPAERNFMVAIEHAEKIRKMPEALSTLQDEYFKALNEIKGQQSLHIDAYKVQYDKLNKVVWISGDGFRVRAAEAASGLQSIIPLVLVTDYLSETVSKSQGIYFSVEEKYKLTAEIERIQANKKLSQALKDLLIESINKQYRLDCFWNIVEEPEQNLYPDSQRMILNVLLSAFNRQEGNGLVLTTHSPYILNDMTISIKAHAVGENLRSEAKKEKLDEIIPGPYRVDKDKVRIFQITDNGEVQTLPTYEGIPSDENYLNAALQESNNLYDRLMDLEEDD